jgi:IS605 OrfB family transposase
VDENGKVYSRAFIHDGKALDKRDKHLARVRRKSSCTMRKKGKLHKGFAKDNYRKAANINKNLARQIARKIFNFAVNSKASVIGLENLKNWKPRGGKKKSSLKQRFQGWLKSAIAKRLQELAEENGISISFVYARSTSKLAYDGTGEVKRDSQNYALATFKSGKKYNADLNASYNIAARYLAYKLKLAAKNGELTVSKKSGVKPRSRVTLSALWVDKETATTALA